jgi:hypothetical protein
VIKRVLAISLRKNWIALMRLHQFNSNWFIFFSFCRTSLTFILLAFLQAYSGLLALHSLSVRAACSSSDRSSDAIWRRFSSHRFKSVVNKDWIVWCTAAKRRGMRIYIQCLPYWKSFAVRPKAKYGGTQLTLVLLCPLFLGLVHCTLLICCQ